MMILDSTVTFRGHPVHMYMSAAGTVKSCYLNTTHEP